MTSKGSQWSHLIKKPLTKLFIHDSSGLYAFPQVLSLVDTSSSKFCLLASKFWDLVLNPSEYVWETYKKHSKSKKPLSQYHFASLHRLISMIFNEKQVL